jgi:uncharacterized membrane protein
VRFHAFQSIFFFAAWFVVIVASETSLVPSVITGLLYCTFFAVWIVLMITAYKGRTLKLPIAGDFAARKAG